jgi:hypothetical protein
MVSKSSASSIREYFPCARFYSRLFIYLRHQDDMNSRCRRKRAHRPLNRHSTFNNVIIRTDDVSAQYAVSRFCDVAGVTILSPSALGGKGFTAIILAWLAKFNTSS